MEIRRDAAPTGAWSFASVAAVGALLVLDVLLGRAYRGVNTPALLVGVVVAGAVAIAPRQLLLATLGAAAVSVVTSFAVHQLDSTVYGPASLGGDAWPGMAELGGLALLSCWALRSLSPQHAAGAGMAVAAALVAIVELRQRIAYAGVLAVLVVLGFTIAAGVGLYLRWIDRDRQRDRTLARQDERLAIARELHDVVAHHVTGIVVQAQAAQAVWEERPAAALDALGLIESAGAEALGSMRRLVGTLRADEPGPLVPAATLEDLRRLAAGSTALGLPVRLHLDGVPEDLPADLTLSVHRVVREAITNAQRHATGATGVDVLVAVHGDELSVDVQDDGRSSRPTRSVAAGYGITGMAERTEALGGHLRAGPTDGGWLVHAVLPLRR